MALIFVQLMVKIMMDLDLYDLNFECLVNMMGMLVRYRSRWIHVGRGCVALVGGLGWREGVFGIGRCRNFLMVERRLIQLKIKWWSTCSLIVYWRRRSGNKLVSQQPFLNFFVITISSFPWLIIDSSKQFPNILRRRIILFKNLKNYNK